MTKIEIVSVWRNSRDSRPDFVLGKAWDAVQHDFTDYLCTERDIYLLPDDYYLGEDQTGQPHIYRKDDGSWPCEVYRHHACDYVPYIADPHARCGVRLELASDHPEVICLPTLEQIADAMIDDNDISGNHGVELYLPGHDLTALNAGQMEYRVSINAQTGDFWRVGDDEDDELVFCVDAELDGRPLEILNTPCEEYEGGLMEKSDLHTDAVYDWEGLDSDGFRTAAEDLLEQIERHFNQ